VIVVVCSSILVCDYGSRDLCEATSSKMNYSKHKYSAVLLDKLIRLDVAN